MEQNAKTAPKTHKMRLTDHQKMACQVIAQAISIALSIRELVRQGYLFGGHILLRGLAERSSILLYLKYYPEEIDKWNRGWGQKEAPSLAKMFEAIQVKQHPGDPIRGSDMTAHMNDLMHSKPASAPWNMVLLDEVGFGHAVSKILDRPELCDELCANAIPWLTVVQCMMVAYFHDDSVANVEGGA
jgi:hypothetical protein